jgi:5'(3')-deoxyribonucleotidase
MKKIIYVDMDNVLVDFKTGIEKLDKNTIDEFEGRLDEVPNIFSLMESYPNAIDSVHRLSKKYDLYILSTAPWLNPSAWIHKLEWVHKHFGKEKDSLFYKRLIISHNKNLNTGEYLIDDRPNNGAKDFKGEWIHFGSQDFPDWDTVTEYLLSKE